MRERAGVAGNRQGGRRGRARRPASRLATWYYTSLRTDASSQGVTNAQPIKRTVFIQHGHPTQTHTKPAQHTNQDEHHSKRTRKSGVLPETGHPTGPHTPGTTPAAHATNRATRGAETIEPHARPRLPGFASNKTTTASRTRLRGNEVGVSESGRIKRKR